MALWTVASLRLHLTYVRRDMSHEMPPAWDGPTDCDSVRATGQPMHSLLTVSSVVGIGAGRQPRLT